MNNLNENQGGANAIPAPVRDQVTADVGMIMHAMAQYNLTADQLHRLLTDAVAGTANHAGTTDEEPAAGAGHVSPLTLLTASVYVAEAAEALTHLYAQQAGRAGFTWADMAAAAGLASPQAAHWRWGKNARDVTEYAPAADRASTPSAVDPAAVHSFDAAAMAMGMLPLVPVTPREEGWVTATELGKQIGRDPRTVREMGVRGEVDVLRRKPGKDGRTRNLYRPLQNHRP